MSREPKTLDDLDTPAVVIDLDIVDCNLRRWQDYCDSHGLANRPHIKTHKVPELAQLQRDLGAKGITCQTLGEAEVMADHGFDDILITYNILGAAKLARLRALHDRIHLRVGCDSDVALDQLKDAAAGLERPIEVVVECDSGALRCGVVDPEQAVDLAEKLDRAAGLKFAGLFTYPPKMKPEAAQVFFEETLGRLNAKGLEAEIVSNGGTPDMWRAHEVNLATEHRVGTYIYNDLMQVAAGAASLEDCALTVLATVVSRAESERGVIDAGSKSLTSDLGGQTGHGRMVEYPDAVIHGLSEEHGHVDFSRAGERPKIGERVRIIPNHVCPVSNLVDRVFCMRNDQVERSFAVAARGKTS
ncbi:MAG: D-TA family PLP-dependent enzyme [Pseudomonadota bacterium]